MLRPISSSHIKLLQRSFQRRISTGSRAKTVKPPSESATSSIPSSTTAFKSPEQATADSPSISLKSLNAFAVSQASAGGSRDRTPPRLPADRLSPRYRDKARRITLAMIAAPIAIVMSYFLAQRVWGGREKLVRPVLREKAKEG